MALPQNITPSIARAIEKKGYSGLTEVQESVIASETQNADLLVSAQTGSGKTVAFGLAIAPTLMGEADRFDRPELPLALVVAPTRELALQVERELVWLFGEAGGLIASCVGGMDARAERRALQRGCHIVVGTPGRLRDHIERGALDMSAMKAVVLDEADEMLDFGFREDLEFILDTAPDTRRTLMFSATVPRGIANLAKRYQKNALRLSTVAEREQHVDIEYKAFSVAPNDRENSVINALRYFDAKSAIVFCKTRQEVNRMASRFGNRGFAVVALSGELSQSERTHALQAMRDGRARVCIATDVAARGIDLPGLELVIHADLPTNADVLKHRSGRTGRAGQKGVCALIVPHTMRRKAQRLLQGARIEASWSAAPSLEEIRAKDTERFLTAPILSAQYDEETFAFARQLLERFGPEQVAAAYISKCQAELPSAEDLLDAPLIDEPSRGGRERPDNRREDREPREAFGESVWFKMTAGRKERAEPRWLLPIICRLGHVTKREVGSIKIGEKETLFEIKAQDAERFMRGVAASGGGEKSIRISPADGNAPVAVKQIATKEKPKREKPAKDAPNNEAPREEGWAPELDDLIRAKPERVRTRAKRPDDASDAPAPYTAKKAKPSIITATDEARIEPEGLEYRPEPRAPRRERSDGEKKQKWTRAKKNAARKTREDEVKVRKHRPRDESPADKKPARASSGEAPTGRAREERKPFSKEEGRGGAKGPSRFAGKKPGKPAGKSAPRKSGKPGDQALKRGRKPRD
ncbi:MAG: DEAD/DEAH box helicase [Parvibaculum sp.]